MTKLEINIREAIPKDAKALNSYIRMIFKTSKHLITSPEEYHYTPWKQRLWIARKKNRKNETCLLALLNGEIVGMLDNWTDQRARVCHVTTFAMSVHPEHRETGIAKQLLSTFIHIIQNHPELEKIELHVHADNSAAIRLYENMGFIHEGIRMRAIHYQDGRVIDDILMALWPKESLTN